MQAGICVMGKALIAAYLITGGLLLLVAFLLFQLEPEESLVSLGIQVIYVLSSLLGGILTGKGMKTRRFFWGMLTGLCYYLLLLLISLIMGNGIGASATQLVVTLALCLAGGMLGGILS